MKKQVEIKINDKGICDYFRINGKEYGKGIYGLDIKIRPSTKPEIQITTNCDEFILDSENNELFLKEDKDEKGE